MIKLTKENLKLIDAINKQVNDEIGYLSDKEHYGVPEKWVPNPEDKLGDCDEYATTKQKRLKEKGIPSYLACVWCYQVRNVWAGYHLVCVVKTDRGDFILDNRFPFVYGYTEAGYRYDKIQSEENPDIWKEVIND